MAGISALATAYSLVGIGTTSTILTERNDKYSIYLGYEAGAATTAGVLLNSAVGIDALNADTIGNNNSAMGGRALQFNISGTGNSAMGAFALYNNTSGIDNTAMGFSAMQGSSSSQEVIILLLGVLP